jgi:Fe-S cluster assembly protein SufD
VSAALDSLARLRAAGPRDRAADLPALPLAEHLNALHEEAYAAFQEQGIPTRRLESWKGTSLARLEAMDFVRVGPSKSISQTDAARAEDVDLVFVDGCLVDAPVSRADLPLGVRVLSLAEAAIEDPETVQRYLGRLPDLKKESLAALQTAFFEDVAIVHLDSRASATRPIRIRSISTSSSSLDSASSNTSDATLDATSDATSREAASPNAAFPRLLVIAGDESQATIVFESVSEEGATGLTAFVAEYHLARGARVETVQLQAETGDRVHFTSTHAHLDRDAHFESHVLSLGDGLVRSELAVTLAEPGAQTKMSGFFLGRNQAHIDHFTTVDHAAEHCTSDEEYRGVLDDESKGVFRGLVIIRPGAQKSDARQSNPNLLLSNHASIDTKPQLEIYADDVRASHGSTIGQLDPDALFFLQARGIEESVARLVLTRGFAQAIVEGIDHEVVRAMVSAQIEEALESLHPADPRSTG